MLAVAAVQTHERGPVNTIEAKRGQELRPLAEHYKSAAFHFRSDPNARLAKHEYRSGNQQDSDEIACVAADRDEAAIHGTADFVAGAPFHQDDTPRMPARLPR